MYVYIYIIYTCYTTILYQYIYIYLWTDCPRLYWRRGKMVLNGFVLYTCSAFLPGNAIARCCTKQTLPQNEVTNMYAWVSRSSAEKTHENSICDHIAFLAKHVAFMNEEHFENQFHPRGIAGSELF